MKFSTSPADRECQEPYAGEPPLEQDGDRKAGDRPSIAEVGPPSAAEDEHWADLTACARADWAAENPF